MNCSVVSFYVFKDSFLHSNVLFIVTHLMVRIFTSLYLICTIFVSISRHLLANNNLSACFVGFVHALLLYTVF